MESAAIQGVLRVRGCVHIVCSEVSLDVFIFLLCPCQMEETTKSIPYTDTTPLWSHPSCTNTTALCFFVSIQSKNLDHWSTSQDGPVKLSSSLAPFDATVI